METIVFQSAQLLSDAVASLPAADQGRVLALPGDDTTFELLAPAEIAQALAAVDPETSAKRRLFAYAADKRWRVETGGITVNGVTIDTSRDSQAMITGAYAYSQAHPEGPIKFKAASGWVTLDAATMAAIATAVGAHVQASFSVEEAIDAAITAGTITSFAEIDAADWPA